MGNWLIPTFFSIKSKIDLIGVKSRDFFLIMFKAIYFHNVTFLTLLGDLKYGGLLGGTGGYPPCKKIDFFSIILFFNFIYIKLTDFIIFFNIIKIKINFNINKIMLKNDIMGRKSVILRNFEKKRLTLRHVVLANINLQNSEFRSKTLKITHSLCAWERKIDSKD